MNVGYAIIVAHSLPRDVPSEKEIPDSWGSAEDIVVSSPDA